MTISAISSVTRVTGTGLNTPISTVFPFFTSADLEVTSNVTATGVDTLLVLGTHYTVSGGSSTGSTGTVTPINGAVDFPATVTWTINRAVALSQSLDYVENDSFPAASHESGMDRLTMQAQDVSETAGRSLTIPVTNITGSGAYDALSNRIKNLDDPTADQDAATKASVTAQVMAASISPYPGTITAAAGTILDDLTIDDILDTLLAGSKGKQIFKDASATSVLNDLNVTALMQSLLLDATTSDARDTLEYSQNLPGKNYLLNSDFQVWQTGEAITAATTPSNSDGNYFADQWVVLSQNPDAVDLSKQIAFLPDGAKAGLLIEVSTAHAQFAIMQPIESSVAIERRSGKVSFSMNIRSASGNLTGMRMIVASWNTPSTRDAMTLDLISSWNGSTASPTPITDCSFVADQAITVTASATDFRIDDVTIPANSENLAVILISNDSSFSATSQLVVSKVKLEPGSVSTFYLSPRYSEELSDCQRFYRSTFPKAVFPSENAGVDGAICASSRSTIGSTTSGVEHYWMFDVPMFKVPTLVTYNPSAAGVHWKANGSANLKSVFPVDVERGGALIGSVPDSLALDVYRIHATADARF